MTDVAIIGTGRMGAAMARRLHDADHGVVLWNRTRASADELAEDLREATVAASPAEAVAQSDVVLTVLANGDVTQEVLLDEDVMAAVRSGQTIVDMGTSGTDTAHSLAAAFAATPAGFVDAPVSGSVATVQAGQLLIMASGDDEAIDHVEPVLAAFSKRVARLGAAGNGQAMKLAVNLVVHGLNGILSESLALAETAGIARAAAYDVLEDSVVAAPFVAYKRESFLEDDAPVAFTLGLVQKDLTLIRELASSLGVPVGVTDAVADVVEHAASRGWADDDMARLRAAIMDEARHAT